MKRRDWLAHCSLSAAMLLSSGFAQGSPARRIVVLGDSLSAEYGLPRGTGWVALLAQRTRAMQPAVEIVNASISGDTTSGGRSRLPAVLKQNPPTHLIIELGGNDALRGLPLRTTRENLEAMVRMGRGAGAKVLLVGMQVPPNYGSRYTSDFAALFAEVAKAEKVPLVPFLLAGVADRPDAEQWFQPDRIHPLAKAHPVMLDNVWKSLQSMM